MRLAHDHARRRLRHAVRKRRPIPLRRVLDDVFLRISQNVARERLDRLVVPERQNVDARAATHDLDATARYRRHIDPVRHDLAQRFGEALG
jgi:hypothetical protein